MYFGLTHKDEVKLTNSNNEALKMQLAIITSDKTYVTIDQCQFSVLYN